MSEDIDKFSVMVVHKFPLDFRTKEIRIAVPKGASILNLDVQFGTPTLWVLLDSVAPHNETIRIGWYGTGHGIPPELALPEMYIGSAVLSQDTFVLHFFLMDDWATGYLPKNAKVTNG